MPRRRTPSKQSRAVLGALLEQGDGWSYGYDLSRRTGLKSGTLYPVLQRLAERNLLIAEWEPDPPEGRPRRHLYRLTDDGAELARAYRTAPAPAPTPATPILAP